MKMEIHRLRPCVKVKTIREHSENWQRGNQKKEHKKRRMFKRGRGVILPRCLKNVPHQEKQKSRSATVFVVATTTADSNSNNTTVYSISISSSNSNSNRSSSSNSIQ